MINEMKCSICGKSIKNSVHYVNVNQPACPHCWEDFYDGSRYLPAKTRRKFQETLEGAAIEVARLEKLIEELKQEKNNLMTQCSKLRKSLAKMYCERFGIEALYYLTHWENLTSILEKGILCYNLIKSKNIPHKSIANPKVREKREERLVGGRSAHCYVPLFFAKRTPMLYEIKSTGRFRQEELVYVCVNSEVLGEDGIHFSDGNVAASSTKVFLNIEELRNLEWNIIKSGSWWGKQEKKEKIQAEVLVPDRVEPSWFQKIVVYNEMMKNKLEATLHKLHIPIEVNQKEFYF